MLFVFLVALLISAGLVPLVMHLARRFNILDRPTAEAKKIHKKPIPLLGGLAIYLSIAVCLVLRLSFTDVLTFGLMDDKHFIGFLLGGLVLMIGGALDDRFGLPPKVMIWFSIAAAALAVLFGTGVSKLSNPFGDPIELVAWQSSLLTFVWLLVVMYTTKFLDGLDGLATGVSLIGVVMILLLALTPAYFQFDAAIFAAVCAGALAGFLLWNTHPAKIFLGEGGSTFVGFTLGILAVIGGSKLGTALLVLSIPLLDVVWVISRRLFVEHRSPTQGDRKHLHHRLLDNGLTHRKVVFWYYVVAAVAGLSALGLQSKQKVLLFVMIGLLMLLIAVLLLHKDRRRSAV